jgi:hypothetical protein
MSIEELDATVRAFYEGRGEQQKQAQATLNQVCEDSAYAPQALLTCSVSSKKTLTHGSWSTRSSSPPLIRKLNVWPSLELTLIAHRH